MYISTISDIKRLIIALLNSIDILLVIDENKLISTVKYEDGDNCGRTYPHIYGEINNDAITKVLPFLKDENNNWIKNDEFKFVENK